MVTRSIFWFLSYVLLGAGSVLSAGELADAVLDANECERDVRSVESFVESLGPSVQRWEPFQTKDMVAFKSFADELQEKWSKGSSEYYGQVMEHLCRPMSSGIFGEHARRVVAREYALSALQEPNEISLELELKLVGHLYSGESEAYAPTDEQWIRERDREVGARVHAWKRLLDALDPNWDVNEAPPWRPSLPRGVRSVEGFAPEYIEDPELRAQYGAAVEEHRRRWTTYSMQNKIHKWARRFPQHQEDAIITAYSRPPHDMAEMERQLKKCVADEQTRAAILDAVMKNIEKEHKMNLQRKLSPDTQGRPE